MWADTAGFSIFDFQVGSIERALASLSAQVVQINKEEELFKWDKTSYPDIKDLLKVSEDKTIVNNARQENCYNLE